MTNYTKLPNTCGVCKLFKKNGQGRTREENHIADRGDCSECGMGVWSDATACGFFEETKEANQVFIEQEGQGRLF